MARFQRFYSRWTYVAVLSNLCFVIISDARLSICNEVGDGMGKLLSTLWILMFASPGLAVSKAGA